MKWVHAAVEVTVALVLGVTILSFSSELLTQADTLSNIGGLALGLVGSVALLRLVSYRVKAYTQ